MKTIASALVLSLTALLGCDSDDDPSGSGGNGTSTGSTTTGSSTGDGGSGNTSTGSTSGGNGTGTSGGASSGPGGEGSGNGGEGSANGGSQTSGTGGDDGSASGGGGAGNDGGTGGGSGGNRPSPGGVPAFCADVGDTFGVGSSIFGDSGTAWYGDAAAAPNDVDWTYGYMYATSDPHADLDGYSWIVNFRLDTAEEAGATIPTATLYRMLYVGQEHGYSGEEPAVVQQMLADPAAVKDYIDDLIVTLEVLNARATPSLLHVEPDSWGFMMWAFDGFDAQGNGDATAVDVALSGANHPALAGESFSDDAAGLARAMLYLRDQYAPEVRMGFHASNFRVGTSPEVVTSFYSTLGDWDVIVTEAPHMSGSTSSSWDLGDTDNQNNINWFRTVSETTGLPIIIWQIYVEDAASYLGAWPSNQDNMTAFAENGVVAILWDPNAVDGSCDYSCSGANDLLDYLSAYSASPLQLPSGSICAN